MITCVFAKAFLCPLHKPFHFTSLLSCVFISKIRKKKKSNLGSLFVYCHFYIFWSTTALSNVLFWGDIHEGELNLEAEGAVIHSVSVVTPSERWQENKVSSTNITNKQWAMWFVSPHGVWFMASSARARIKLAERAASRRFTHLGFIPFNDTRQGRLLYGALDIKRIWGAIKQRRPADSHSRGPQPQFDPLNTAAMQQKEQPKVWLSSDTRSTVKLRKRRRCLQSVAH